MPCLADENRATPGASRVALINCGSYEPDRLGPAVARAVELAGPMSDLIHPGDRVLIKPNLLDASPLDKRVTTDPALVRAVAALAKDAGGRVSIGDSPGLDSGLRVARKCGLDKVASELGCELVELDQPSPAPPHEKAVFRNLELARRVLEADVVISLPKLKTHCMMLLTLGVKNLFGCVVAQRKAEWHHMAGVDRQVFASLLIDVWLAAKPALTVLDGVWGMQGRGPANGSPRHFGVIAASRDALALDLALCDYLGVDRMRPPINRAAFERGLWPAGVEKVGDGPVALQPAIELPELDSLNILPGVLAAWGRKRLVSKPVQDQSRCAHCEKCLEICPARAMEMRGGRIRFDYDACIRCYCCQEVCPADAISFKKGLLVRILQGLGR